MWYHQQNDGKFYKKLDYDTTEENQKKVKKAVNNLINRGKLPTDAKALLVDDPKSAAFYLLPKIHKEGIPGRPVVSNVQCPTVNISQLISEYLRSTIKKFPSYLKDTNHLHRTIEEVEFPPEAEVLLFTLDVKSLYTNIPHKEGLKALKSILAEYDEGDLDHTAILRLAELVLTINCIEFNGEFFCQIWGTMMGTKMGVEYAVIFKEYIWLNFQKF